jgi:hypothetical protein
MHNLLTGKSQDASHPEPKHNTIVEDEWPAEAYLAAMRRNLYAASKPGADKTTLMLAANTLALAAQAARRTPAPILPRDGDAL